MRWSSSSTSPESGLTNPTIVWKEVVLPAPLGPNSPTTSPCSTRTETLSTTLRPLYDFEISTVCKIRLRFSGCIIFITPSARLSCSDVSKFELQALASRTTLLHDTRSSACYPAMAAGDLAAVGAFGMSKQHEAELILKLYELRRDETMRKARDWFFLEFHPEAMEDFNRAMFSE